MASRLLFQKLSGMCRTTRVVGVHGPDARATVAPKGGFHGIGVHHGPAAPINPVIHGYTARYFNVFPCSHADAKTSLTTTGMPSTIMNSMKPAFLDFARGLKQTFSSSASESNSHKFAMEAKMAARQAQGAACKPRPPSVFELVKREVDTPVLLMAFTSFGCLYMLANESPSTDGSGRCLNCCNCQCHGSNPKAQQD